MKKIMFIANNRTALSGMTFLIEQMQKKYASVVPVLVCEFCYYKTEKYCVINLSEKDEKALGQLESTILDFYNTDRKKVRKQVFQFFNNYRKMSVDDKKSKDILRDVNPDALVVGCDRMGGILQGFLKNAGDIPIIKVPVALQYDYRTGFSNRYYDYELILTENKWDMNKLMFLINKSWVRCINNESRVFYPLGYTLAGWVRGMVSMHPWVSGGGKTTYVLAASADERDMILEEVDKPIVVTGAIEDYYILSEKEERVKIADEIKKKYHVNGKIVVFALPQLAEHNMVTWDIHTKNMEKLLRILHEEYGMVLISLHPKSDIENYRYLSEYGSFLEERLRDVICGTDLLIAVSASSVLHWAEMLQIDRIAIDTKCLQREIGDPKKVLLNMEMGKERTDDTVNSVKCVADEIMSIVGNN